MVHQQKPGDALQAAVPNDLAGQRLDLVLARLFEQFSRSRMQRWVRDGRVDLDGTPCLDTRARVHGGEWLSLRPAVEPAENWSAQAIALDVVHRDGHLLVVNKPAGLVVHPGAGNREGTLVNALVHLDAAAAALPRAGLVHRLDKNTTGLMVVARTLEAHTALTRLIAQHRVHRGYEAIVHGITSPSGNVDAPVGRHRIVRTRMSVNSAGRDARTHFRRLAAFRAHSHLALELETGRTHQIRVHMAHLSHPIVGDRDYGGVRPTPASMAEATSRTVMGFSRQALHARRLRFEHPMTGEDLDLSVPLPTDMAALLAVLAADAS